MSAPSPMSADELYARGWESDDEGVTWWREEHPEGPIYSFNDAVQVTENWLDETRAMFEEDKRQSGEM